MDTPGVVGSLISGESDRVRGGSRVRKSETVVVERTKTSNDCRVELSLPEDPEVLVYSVRGIIYFV